MMKKLFSLGEGAIPQIKTAFDVIFDIYAEFQAHLEESAYVVQDVEGRQIRQHSPKVG